VKETVYRARCVLPISRPRIDDGWVATNGNTVTAIGGPEECPPHPPIDLGDVAILPALVIAHTHREFSYFFQPIGKTGIKLHDWIGEVVRSRNASGASDAIDGAATIQNGLRLCQHAYTGLVGEIATTPYPWPSSLDDDALDEGSLDEGSPDVVAFAEVLGLVASRSEAKLLAAAEHFKRFENRARITPGISPHAPYSTPLAVVQRCVEMAIQNRSILAMHVAESIEERQLIEYGDGPFSQRLREIQLFSDDRFPWGREATKNLLALLSRAPRALLIHGNDLRDDELSFIAQERQMTVVYCPRTHAFFGHAKHRVAEMLNAGIRVALGTDSLASNPDLSIWGEVQWLLSHRDDLDWQSVIAMATLHGADALGRKDWGRIEVGSKAKLLKIPFSHDRARDSFLDHQPSWIKDKK